MNDKRIVICPVCGMEQLDSNTDIKCDVCGFEFAYVSTFNSKTGIAFVNEKAVELKAAREDIMPINAQKWQSFVINGKIAAFITRYDSKLIYEGANEFKGIRDNIVQFSASEKHVAVLYEDGTVYAEGDNEYGQLDVSDMKDITYIYAAANCTYGIDKSGKIHYSGSIPDNTISAWENVRKIVSSEKYTIAITKDDKAICYGGIDDDFISGLGEVADAAVMGKLAIFLKKNGKVSFYGDAVNNKDIVESWSNIVAVALDNMFAYGLTADGRIVVAGKCKHEFLDKGRSNAAKEKEVVAISACKSGFAAVKRDGSLYLAGNLDEEIYEKMKPHKRDIVRNMYGNWE